MFVSILYLIAGAGVFLVSCNLMSDNLEALGGARLKAMLAKTSKNKLIGVGAGAAVTAAIQSSSAATVMVLGFVNAGIMSLPQAATIIFGANIGTTVTGQLVALGMLGGNSVSASVILAALAGAGAFIMLLAKRDRLKKTGGIFAGFGMLFVGLNMMSGAMSGLAELDGVRLVLSSFKSPLLLVLTGVLFTALVQSSSVVTSMTITMTVTGLLTLTQGVYIAMGSNIGTCITAIIAGLAGTKNARRAALIHLIFNVSGVVLFLFAGLIMRVFGTDYGSVLNAMFPDMPQIQLSMFHTIFNLTTVVIVLPFTDALIKLVNKIIPN